MEFVIFLNQRNKPTKESNVLWKIYFTRDIITIFWNYILENIIEDFEKIS